MRDLVDNLLIESLEDLGYPRDFSTLTGKPDLELFLNDMRQTFRSESESQVRPSRQARSAPASGKTRGGQATSTTSTTPLRRLAHTNSSSSLQGKSNRSSSSLTSKELEFQAWKRRKDYDPRKAAARPSSSRKVSAGSSQGGGGGGGGQSSQARHSKLSMLSSSAMTKSLVIEELSSDAPMQRSNSFHLNGKVREMIFTENGHPSHDHISSSEKRPTQQ